MEDNLGWKITIDRRRPLVEDDLQWRITLHGRQHLTQGSLTRAIWWAKQSNVMAFDTVEILVFQPRIGSNQNKLNDFQETN